MIIGISKTHIAFILSGHSIATSAVGADQDDDSEKLLEAIVKRRNTVFENGL